METANWQPQLGHMTARAKEREGGRELGRELHIEFILSVCLSSEWRRSTRETHTKYSTHLSCTRQQRKKGEKGRLLSDTKTEDKTETKTV